MRLTVKRECTRTLTPGEYLDAAVPTMTGTWHLDYLTTVSQEALALLRDKVAALGLTLAHEGTPVTDTDLHVAAQGQKREQGANGPDLFFQRWQLVRNQERFAATGASAALDKWLQLMRRSPLDLNPPLNLLRWAAEQKGANPRAVETAVQQLCDAAQVRYGLRRAQAVLSHMTELFEKRHPDEDVRLCFTWTKDNGSEESHNLTAKDFTQLFASLVELDREHEEELAAASTALAEALPLAQPQPQPQHEEPPRADAFAGEREELPLPVCSGEPVQSLGCPEGSPLDVLASVDAACYTASEANGWTVLDIVHSRLSPGLCDFDEADDNPPHVTFDTDGNWVFTLVTTGPGNCNLVVRNRFPASLGPVVDANPERFLVNSTLARKLLDDLPTNTEL